MSIAISDLNITENYADDKILNEAQLNETEDSVEVYVNSKIKDNLVQLACDVMGINNYTFNDDGLPSLTNTVFNKQTQEDDLVSGDISIGIAPDVGWSNVNAIDASVTITPELPGKYKATFMFTHTMTTQATTEGGVEVSFRLTDGTTASNSINSGGYLPATAANSGVLRIPVCLSCYFDWTTTTPKTVILQKYVRSAAALTSNVVCSTSATGELAMIVEKV